MRVVNQISSATGTIIFAFFLAMAMIIAMAIWLPEALTTVQHFASDAEDWLRQIDVPASGEVWLNFLVGDQQIVFLIFTIFARIVIAVVWALVKAIFGFGER